MKNIILTSIVLLFFLVARSQCTPLPIYGSYHMRVGDTSTFTNANVGGRWSMADTNIAVVDETNGRVTGKSVGTTTVSYFMPGACMLFPSVMPLCITSGMILPRKVNIADTEVLSDSVITTGTWRSGDTTIAVVNPSTGVAKGISKGMVLISYTFTSSGVSCTAVNYLHVTSGIHGRKKQYIGNLVTYNDTISGGTWNIADTNIAAVNDTTGVIRAKTQGMTLITYTKVTGSTVCSGWDTIFVGKGIRSFGKICSGDTLTYLDSVAGGHWSIGDTSIAYIDATSGLLSSRALGTTTVTYTITTAGTTFTLTDSLQVITTPTLPHLSTIDICAGSRGYFIYSHPAVKWYSYDSSIVTFIDSPDWYYASTAFTAPTPVTIRYTSNYCSRVTDYFVAIVDPLPSPGTITTSGIAICPGDSATIAWSGTGVSGYWGCGGRHATINSATGVVTALPTFISEYEDVYHVTTNAFGCQAATWNYIDIMGSPNPGVITGRDTLNIGLIGNFGCTGWGTSDSWSVSPTSVATVSAIGELTPLSVGTVTLKHFFMTSCGVDSCSRTVVITPPAVGVISSAFVGFVNSYCAAPQFGVDVFPHASTFTLCTYYGDGNIDTLVIPPATSIAVNTYNHFYGTTGSYSIKQLLLDGATRVDSVVYTYTHVSCNSISLSFFQDVDHDCVYTASVDHINYAPLTIVVDSNGVAIDTISATSGLYYEEWGIPGDIYSFRVISSTATISCPSTGVVYDTLQAISLTTKSKSVAITCTSSGFDVSESSSSSTGRHHFALMVHGRNSYCSGEDATVLLNYDSRYSFTGASISPTSVTATTVRWDFTNISSISGTHPDINVDFEVPGTWLTPGTVINTNIAIIPTTGGDLDTTNNNTVRQDTVKSSYDPNYIQVSPSGNILNGTNLHYTIEFENDGNDTAHNIYVMDTLPSYLNVSSLRVVTATAKMNTSIIRSGGYTIVKFDFPGIMLPDSSHHYHCTGSVMFNIKTNRGIANGTSIINHAGIFFDDNPVVLTDTTFNTILVPALTASSTCHDTICHGGPIHCTSSVLTINSPHYQWYKNTTPVGTDSASYTSTTIVAGDSIKCVLRTIMDDTVLTASNVLHITERALPNPGSIYGTSVVCPGNSITLTDSATGGSWSMSNARATIATGVVTGVTPGNDTAIYTVSNICYNNATRFPLTIHALPYASSITGYTVMCDTSAITLSDTAAAGSWYLSNTHASISATGRVTGISGGNVTAFYYVTNMCGADTASYALHIDSVVHLSVPSGLSGVCQGDSILLTAAIGGGTWSATSSHASVSASGLVTGITGGVDTIKYTITNSCGSFMNSKVVIISPTLVPSVTVTVTPGTTICQGDTVLLTTSYVNAGTTPSFVWTKFGTVIGSGATLNYTPSVGDIVVCKMSSNALCRSTDTVFTNATLAVTPALTPIISIIATPGDTVAYSGQLITFYSTITYGGTAPTFQWYANGVAIPGETNNSYSRNVNSNDTVTCTMTSNIPCATANTVTSNTMVIYADYLSVHSFASGIQGLSLFPNPNKGSFTLAGKTKGNSVIDYEVLEMTGKIVYSGTIDPTSGAVNQQINLGNTLAPGQYTIKVISGTESGVLHFVIE